MLHITAFNTLSVSSFNKSWWNSLKITEYRPDSILHLTTVSLQVFIFDIFNWILVLSLSERIEFFSTSSTEQKQNLSVEYRRAVTHGGGLFPHFPHPLVLCPMTFNHTDPFPLGGVYPPGSHLRPLSSLSRVLSLSLPPLSSPALTRSSLPRPSQP